MAAQDCIDQAQLCVHHLKAIEQLLAQAATGNNDMEFVSPDSLSLLLKSIIDNLDNSLDQVAKVIYQPHLQSV